MANPSIKRLAGPVAFAASAANIYNQASTLVFDIIKHIHVVNTTAGALTFWLYQSQTTGTETAGKELFVAQSVGANAAFDYYCNLKQLSTDFLVGHSTVTTLTITVEGETYAV
jgi:hypothetical protein